MPVLLSRSLDPMLGVFTGVFAYYLAENNPRTGPTPDQKLIHLVRRKWSKWRVERNLKVQALETENIDWHKTVIPSSEESKK